MCVGVGLVWCACVLACVCVYVRVGDNQGFTCVCESAKVASVCFGPLLCLLLPLVICKAAGGGRDSRVTTNQVEIRRGAHAYVSLPPHQTSPSPSPDRFNGSGQSHRDTCSFLAQPKIVSAG